MIKISYIYYNNQRYQMTNYFSSLSFRLTNSEEHVISLKLNNKKLQLKLISRINSCFSMDVSTEW
jgi:hypothetical protein